MAALIAAATATQSQDRTQSLLWGYSDSRAPVYWGDLTPQFHVCRTGTRQSPVNIPADLDPGFTVRPVMQYQPTVLRAARSPYHIALNLTGSGGLVLDGISFTADFVTFRNPAEHQLAGRSFPLEAQIHHHSADGQKLILSVLFERGDDNAMINLVLPHLPARTNSAVVTVDALINPLALLPTGGALVRYEGSLTTPPCDEQVIWLVAQAPQTVSGRQISLLGRFIKGNSRPVQPPRGRFSALPTARFKSQSNR